MTANSLASRTKRKSLKRDYILLVFVKKSVERIVDFVFDVLSYQYPLIKTLGGKPEPCGCNLACLLWMTVGP